MPRDLSSTRTPDASQGDYELDRIAWNLPMQKTPPITGRVAEDAQPESAGDAAPASNDKKRTEVLAKGSQSLRARILGWLWPATTTLARKTPPGIVALR